RSGPAIAGRRSAGGRCCGRSGDGRRAPHPPLRGTFSPRAGRRDGRGVTYDRRRRTRGPLGFALLPRAWSMRRFLATSFLCLSCAPAWAIDVDGRIDPDEWAGARHVTDFRMVEPLTREPSPYPTEAWIKATPEGLAIAFRNVQGADVPRTYQRTQRDQDAQVDRVNLMVDFDGDGRTGYNFTVNLTDGIQDATITNESRFSKDWDGIWQHAVGEDGDTWSVEMLIPWYIAPMREGTDGTRTLGL